MKQKIKVLHLEDMPSDAELVAWELKKGNLLPEIQVVSNKAAFVHALTDFRYDVILSDHSLASFDSLEAIRLVKKAGITVPFILVTAAMTDEFAAKIMKEGAYDYIIKDRMSRLQVSVVNAIEKSRLKAEIDIEQNKNDEEKKKLATRLQLATRAAGIGIWEWDIQKNHLLWDEGMYRLYHMDILQFGSVYEGWISKVHHEDRRRVNEDIQMAVAGRRKYDTEFRVIWDDGSIHTIKATGVVELDNTGKPDRMIGANWDISSQRLTEEKLIKANRLYTIISQINQSIVRLKDEKVLFRTVCDIALEFGMFKMAWIGLFDKMNKAIAMVDQNGIPEEDIHRFKNIPLKTDSPQQHVLNSGKYFVSNDIANDPRLQDWKVMSAGYGVNSCIILPVKKSGNVVGTFNLYSGKLNFYDEEEIALLLEVTGDISFALDTFEKEKKHKAAEELVFQNEKLYRALIENSADMITLGNREGKLVYGSPSITTVLGYSPKELINMSLFDVVHPDDIPELLESRNMLIKNPGEAFNFQRRRKHKSGNWVWCEGTFTNLLDEPGINAIVTNFRDVSQKKIAGEQKEFDRNNLDALINNTNDLMWSVDMDFNLITSNQPFSDILRFTAGHDVAKGDNVLDAVYSPQQAEPYKKLYQRAFTGESFTEIIYNELPVDSWSEISYCPIRKGDEVIGAACHSRDITEKIKAERQVIVIAKRFRALVENSADAVAILSPDGSASYVSPSIQKVLGYTEEEGMNLNMFTIMHPDDVATVEPAWLQMLAGRGPPVPVITCRIWHKNGTWRWMEGILTNLMLDSSINGIVNNFRDITEKKLAALERAKMVNDLMLRNTELEQFGYIISHNLRAPVANIIGASSALNEPDLSTEDKDILNKGINTSVIKLDNIVKDLNHILQVKSNINQPKETVHFSVLIDDIKISIQNLIDKHHVEISCDFSEVDEFVTLKPYLYSIFYNLISNSIKYRRQQTHTTIEIKSRLEKNKMELIFTDNGMGINLKKSGGDIFGLYKRFHHHIEGKGMGLFMVKTQVETIGGKISVQSIENEGTVFTIEFEI